jgi:hypothetical protein
MRDVREPRDMAGWSPDLGQATMEIGRGSQTIDWEARKLELVESIGFTKRLEDANTSFNASALQHPRTPSLGSRVTLVIGIFLCYGYYAVTVIVLGYGLNAFLHAIAG